MDNKETYSSDEEHKVDKPSYTYWKRDGDKSGENEFKPQKSDNNVDSNNNSNTYGSVWNSAGTW
jgi:hypothetical protein